MPVCQYRTKLYERETGAFIADLTDHLRARKLNFIVNEADTYGFNIHHDAPGAGEIKELETFVRVWRDMEGRDPRPEGLPNFCGFMGSPTRNAASRTTTWKAYSPLWRLQHRYHVDQHDLGDPFVKGAPKGRNPNGPFKPSRVMWMMITFTAQVDVANDPPYPTYSLPDDFMGLRLGFLNEDNEAPYPVKYPRGTNTWTLVSDIVIRPGMPDLSCTYMNDPADPTAMLWFITQAVNGLEKSDITMDFNAGADNLVDMGAQTITDPGAVGTYSVVEGHLRHIGQKRDDDSAAQAVVNDAQSIVAANGQIIDQEPYVAGMQPLQLPDTIARYGKYILWNKIETAMSAQSQMTDAIGFLKRAMYPPMILSPVWPRGSDCGFDHDWAHGDGVRLSCDAGPGMQFSNIWRRVMEVELDLDDHGGEQCTPKCVIDYDELVTPSGSQVNWV